MLGGGNGLIERLRRTLTGRCFCGALIGRLEFKFCSRRDTAARGVSCCLDYVRCTIKGIPRCLRLLFRRVNYTLGLYAAAFRASGGAAALPPPLPPLFALLMLLYAVRVRSLMWVGVRRPGVFGVVYGFGLVGGQAWPGREHVRERVRELVSDHVHERVRERVRACDFMVVGLTYDTTRTYVFVCAIPLSVEDTDVLCCASTPPPPPSEHRLL